jgi:hypothetical protein
MSIRTATNVFVSNISCQVLLLDEFDRVGSEFTLKRGKRTEKVFLNF